MEGRTSDALRSHPKVFCTPEISPSIGIASRINVFPDVNPDKRSVA
jgi:hypothetical protein